MKPKRSLSGLSAEEARRRLAAEGPNALPASRGRGILRIIADVLREPMLALLLVAGLVYASLGDRTEALILLFFATFSIIVTVVQEARTEHILESLRDLTSPRALVVRDGETSRIPGAEVVRGDILVLSEGDRIPADARIVMGADLVADESLLTGESVPVAKKMAAARGKGLPRPGEPGAQSFVFAGALLVRGEGLAEVVATGPRSEIGRIGQSIATQATEQPRLQVQTQAMVRMLGMGGVTLALMVVGLYGFLKADWLGGALAGISLSMALLPEEFPVILTVFMAVGAWRISQARVLTRRAASIESLGAATVLCTDKTGTLTQNRMAIQALRAADAILERHPDPQAAPETSLIRAGFLASQTHPTDPMDAAFHVRAADLGCGAETGAKPIQIFRLSDKLLAVTQVWEWPDGHQEAAVKGAPEAIADLCRLGGQDRARYETAVDELASAGLRVLAVAHSLVSDGKRVESPAAIPFQLVGLVGLSDPIRPEAREAVTTSRTAGIRIVMITGDNLVTARAIAGEAGIGPGGEMTGAELAALDDAALDRVVRDIVIFARVQPEQKLRIVNALKRRGEIVAMTGDGVNDAPSLRAAHIGVAMGGRGTDVAREAAALVLLDDDFGSIVKTIRLGRRIYDNLRKAMGFVFAIHIPIAGIAILPLILGLPVIFGPIHIAFLEMIIDPVCSLVFEAEPEEKDVMRRPPRKPKASLFSLPFVAWSILQGLLALALVAAILALGLRQSLPDDEIRSLVYFSLIVATLALIFVNRSFSASVATLFSGANRAMLAVPVVVCGSLAVMFGVPAAARAFSFGPLHSADVGTGIAGAIVLYLCLQLAKPLAARALRD